MKIGNLERVVEIKLLDWNRKAKEWKISKYDREVRKVRAFLREVGLLGAMESACLAKQKDILSLFQKYIREGVGKETKFNFE